LVIVVAHVASAAWALEDLGKLACQPLHRGRGGIVANLVRRVACLPSVASIAVK
jgi:hypothetical protein